MTAPTTQSRELTAEKIDALIRSATLEGHVYPKTLAKNAYQIGRESVLTELRAGGVELPEPDGVITRFAYIPAWKEATIKDYGDRRAAAAVPDGWMASALSASKE